MGPRLLTVAKNGKAESIVQIDFDFSLTYSKYKCSHFNIYYFGALNVKDNISQVHVESANVQKKKTNNKKKGKKNPKKLEAQVSLYRSPDLS